MAPLSRLALALALVAAGTPALAQTPVSAPVLPAAGAPGVDAGRRMRPAAVRTAQDKEARAHFMKAEKAFNLGKFAEALTAYEAAYEARPLPAMLFNIAQCHRNLGDPERAIFFYRRYLALESDRADHELVQELIAEQQRVQRDRDRAAGSAARAERQGPAGPPARRPGPPGPTVTSPDPAALAVAPTPAPAPEPPLHKRWWVWTAAGVAVVALTAALVIPRQGPLPMGQLESVDRR
jgi:tetratricopeptide (TPR) repeat protein